MIDPYTGFIIDVEPLNENHADVLNMPIEDPGTDLVNISHDEEPTNDEDFEDGSMAKKRVWCESDKQEWLNIYEQYMKKRVKRKSQPLDTRGHQAAEGIDGGNSDNTVNTSKAGEKIYVDLSDMEQEETVITSKPHAKTYVNLRDTEQEETEHEDDENMNFDEHEEVQDSSEYYGDYDGESIQSKMARLQNLRYNSLLLVKYSNLCLFKWSKHYYVCYECLQRFRDMVTLRSHFNNTHTYEQIERKMVKEKNTLQNMYHKADITDLECKVCCVALKNLSELENHLIHHDVLLKLGGYTLIPYRLCTKKLVCQLCEDTFVTIYRLQRHMDGHFLDYVCPECNMGFPNARCLKKHCQSHNKSAHASKDVVNQDKDMAAEKATFNCSQCPEKFVSFKNRLHHFNEKHNKPNTLFHCDFCPKIFMTLHWLTKHKNCVHKDELYS